MTSLPEHRVLIVENDLDFAALMRVYARKLDGVADFTFVTSKSEALDAASKVTFHFVSIDQKIPDRPDEADIDDNGLELCAELGVRAPLTRRTIYTSNPTARLARLVGQLDGTEYYQKYAESGSADTATLERYFDEIIRGALDTYPEWALSRARDVLPPIFGVICSELAERLPQPQLERDVSALVSDRINWLWEKTVWLQWAHAIALMRAAGLGPLLRTVPIEPLTVNLVSLWEELASARWFRPLRKYTTRPPKPGKMDSVGGAFRDASDTLRHFRNDGAHHSRSAISRSDLKGIEGALVSWIDMLAFWADHPMLIGPRVHPSDRRMLQAVAFAGQPPQRTINLDTAANVPQNEVRQGHVFSLHNGPDGDVLVDLFPLVSLLERPGQMPEPTLVVPSIRGARRFSLLEDVERAAPLTQPERDGFQSLFGARWRPNG
jgi:ActR/RegA family two-component response regulator